jgi:hypothetical protein
MLADILLPAFLAMLAMLLPSVAHGAADGIDELPGVPTRELQERELETRGIGFLMDHCDQDWNVARPHVFYGRCENSKGTREWMHIDLDNCYTVDDKG